MQFREQLRLVGHLGGGESAGGQVGKRETEAFARRIRDTRLCRNISERSIAIIVVEDVGYAVVIIRM